MVVVIPLRDWWVVLIAFLWQLPLRAFGGEEHATGVIKALGELTPQKSDSEIAHFKDIVETSLNELFQAHPVLKPFVKAFVASDFMWTDKQIQI